MVKRIFPALIAIFCVQPVSAREPRTVDQMSCAAVVRQVEKLGRYYLASVDGALPIYPVYPMPGEGEYFGYCKGKEQVWINYVKTRDVEECEVGFQCSRTG